MAILDATEQIKSQLGNTRIVLKENGFEVFDGYVRTWTDASGTWTFLYETGFEELRFIGLNITYGEYRPSNLPKEFRKKQWVLENRFNVPDKRPLTLTLSYTESVVAGVTTTITEGRSSTFKADVNFGIGVIGRASAGYSETLTVSVQNGSTTSKTKTNVQVENYDFSYEIPAQSAVLVELTKELVPYELPFKAEFTVDADIYVIATNKSNGNRQTKIGDRRWGRLSEYLSEAQRTFVIDGLITEIVGEKTTRSARPIPLEGLPRLDALTPELSELHGLPLSGGKTNNASIRLVSMSSFDGYFDATFQVDTGNCQNSICAGFSANLVLDVNNELEIVPYSFEGWTVADTGVSVFTIVRQGYRGGVLLDISDIESPPIVCEDVPGGNARAGEA